MRRVLILALVAGCSMPKSNVESGFHRRTVNGRTLQIFVPAGYHPSEAWPCVVFLHGVGENGSDGERQTMVGLGPRLRAMESTFPAIVLFPQNRGPWKFNDVDVLASLAAAESEFNIDRSRLYLTGLSQGGCSTYDLGAKFASKWAALLVVCGAGRPQDAPRLTMPVWAFHGERDTAIPPSGPHGYDAEGVGSRDLVPRLANGRYTEFAGEGHAIWDRVYSDPEVWTWLFAQRRQ